MRKTTITAAALAMSASLAGLAYAAAPDGRSTEDSSVVSTFTPADSSPTDSTSASTSPSSRTSAVTPTASPSDDHGRDGHGADDGVPGSTPSMPTGTHQRHDGSDDGVGHDVGDDHGRGGHGADDGADDGDDDGAGHDVGDDHGGDRGGDDDSGSGSRGGDSSGSGSGSGG
jgi:hypothetical protein